MKYRLRTAPRTVWGLVALFGTCTGCSGSTEPDPYANVSEFCEGKAKAECAANVITACAAPDATKCQTARQATCAAQAPANSSYQQTRAKECLSRVETAYSDARLTADELTSMREACVPVFDGRSDTGESCTKDTDCKVSRGQKCVFHSATGSMPSAGGACQIPKVMTGGESCVLPEAMCIEGFHCGATNHCDVNSGADEICSALLPCKKGLMCSPAGKCVPKSVDGSNCTSDDDCGSNICLAGSGSGGSGLCVSQLILSPRELFCVDIR